MGEFDQAERYLQQSLDLLLETETGEQSGWFDSTRERAFILTTWAEIEMSQSRFAEAMEKTRTGLTLYQECGYRDGEALAGNRFQTDYGGFLTSGSCSILHGNRSPCLSTNQ